MCGAFYDRNLSCYDNHWITGVNDTLGENGPGLVDDDTTCARERAVEVLNYHIRTDGD